MPPVCVFPMGLKCCHGASSRRHANTNAIPWGPGPIVEPVVDTCSASNVKIETCDPQKVLCTAEWREGIAGVMYSC